MGRNLKKKVLVFWTPFLNFFKEFELYFTVYYTLRQIFHLLLSQKNPQTLGNLVCNRQWITSNFLRLQNIIWWTARCEATSRCTAISAIPVSRSHYSTENQFLLILPFFFLSGQVPSTDYVYNEGGLGVLGFQSNG